MPSLHERYIRRFEFDFQDQLTVWARSPSIEAIELRMVDSFLPRTLWYYENKEKIELAHTELHKKFHPSAQPLIILGEAGMGKTTLLKWLAEQHGYIFVTAHQLLHPPRSLKALDASQTLVIDALDELTGHTSVEAIDRVLDNLGEKGYPPFMLSCRAADWFGSAAVRSVESKYEQSPVQLHLRALNEQEILLFLDNTLSSDVALDLVERLRARRLEKWLGNPYTLELLVESAKEGERPESRTQIFEFATRHLLKERNVIKAACGPSQDLRRHAAGAACAALIFSGHEALCRTANTFELSLPEVQNLPDAVHLSHALATRLFVAADVDRFKYAHRSLGEYLAARWLMRCAVTHRKRRKLLNLFHRQYMVPNHLRGLHAWLALDTHLAAEVIAKDPMGIIEYGDVGLLGGAQASMLLRALGRLTVDNPGCLSAYHQLSLREMIKPGVETELLSILTDKDMPFQLRFLLLESIQGSPVAKQFGTVLRSLVAESGEAFGLRRAALEALCAQQSPAQARELLVLLSAECSDDNNRLALDLLGLHGYSFPVNTTAKCVIDCEHQNLRIGEMSFKYEHFVKHFPSEQIASFLNVLTASISPPEPFSHEQQRSQLADVVMQLIGRYLKGQVFEVCDLWKWLHFSGLHNAMCFLADETHQQLRDQTALRHRLQRWVLLENAGEIGVRQRHFDLHLASYHLACSEEDAIVLLKTLDPQDLDDQRWQEIVGLIFHTEDEGLALRDAAHDFAAGHADRLEWLAQLQLYDSNRELSAEAAEREQQEIFNNQQKLLSVRQTFLHKIEPILEGDFTCLIEPAQVYLGSKAFRSDACDIEHLRGWLGDDLAQWFLLGFETYLQQITSSLPLTEISHFLGQQQWFFPATDLGAEEGLSPFIIAAALIARQKNGRDFKDLVEPILLAGFLVVHYLFESDYGSLLTGLSAELKSRMLLKEALRLRYEPRLLGGFASGELNELLYDDDARIFAAELARTWLEQFDLLPAFTERELVRMLLKFDEFKVLRSMSRTRTLPTEEHRLIWDAVGLVVSFEDTRERLAQKRPNKHLLEELVELVIRSYSDYYGRVIKLDIPLMAWIIRSFCFAWPQPLRRQGDLINTEDSYRNEDMAACLVNLIDNLGNLTTPEAIEALQKLCSVRRNSYTERLLDARANQRRLLYDLSSTPSALEDLQAFTNDAAPDDEAALKAFVLEELEVVQQKITSDDVDSWRSFYGQDEVTPLGEEICRDRLISLLRQGSSLVAFEPEAHLAADKRADIACSVGMPRICIEVKGQWHPSVWTAADDQLDKLYTCDHRASGIGIYLVLWFGKQTDRKYALRKPKGKSARPSSPAEMKCMLEERCQAFQQERIAIVVLDLTR